MKKTNDPYTKARSHFNERIRFYKSELKRPDADHAYAQKMLDFYTDNLNKLNEIKRN